MQLIEVSFQSVEFPFPEPAVLIYPGVYLRELIQTGFAKALTSLLPDMHQATFFEHLDVFRYGRSADVKVLGDRVDRERLSASRPRIALRVGSEIAWKTSRRGELIV